MQPGASAPGDLFFRKRVEEMAKMEIVYSLKELKDALRADMEDNFDLTLPLNFDIVLAPEASQDDD